METTETKMVKIADIKVGERKRQVDAKRAESLTKSIRTVGLISPITVNAKFELIAGNHRLEAFKALGKTEIPARIIDVNKLQAEMIEIDENLVRKELTELEKSEQLKRRKELYEQLHPEATKKAITKKNLSKCKNSTTKEEDIEPVKTFVEDTAEQTGESKRSIYQKIYNAQNITLEAKEKIKGTPLEDKTTVLTRIGKTEPEKQLEVVEEELKKLKEPKRVKVESKTENATVKAESAIASDSQVSATQAEETPVQAEPVNITDNQTSEKELDIAYKVDFVRRKVAVDGKWLDLPPEYNMDNNSFNAMVMVAKNYLTTKGKIK